MLALVKPTYELHAGSLVTSDKKLAAAVSAARAALVEEGWHVNQILNSPISGGSGAREVFIYAVRER